MATQLHPTRNGPLDARAVSAGSPARLWWQCPAGHEWQAAVKSRTRGADCPSCAGRLPTADTCLAARHPVLAGQWHPTRNDSLTPADVLPTANRRVWWQCPVGHEWPAKVRDRTRGTGCPYCPRDKPATTLLAGYPDLARQWDTTVNGELTATVTSGSNRRVGWRCLHGHRWVARVQSRTQGRGCPYCAGKRATPETSVAARHPQLMGEWAHHLNGDLDPGTVPPGSNRLVWWRCTTDPDHVWQGRVADRVSRATRCPFCTGTRVTPRTSLAATHPQVAAEWDPDRNGDRTPATVAAGSKAVAWWRCAAGHRWRGQIGGRTSRNSPCPFCSGRRATPATSLAAIDPVLAAEWDPDRNGDLTPAGVRPFSNKPAWWRCPAGHSWEASIGQRSRRHTGCPVCASHCNHGRLLVTTRPDLAAQWSELLNGGSPGTLTTGSKLKAWWRCPTDPTHLWRATIKTSSSPGTTEPAVDHAGGCTIERDLALQWTRAAGRGPDPRPGRGRPPTMTPQSWPPPAASHRSAHGPGPGCCPAPRRHRPGFKRRDVMSAAGDAPGVGRPGESVLMGGPPSEDAATAVAVLKVQFGGSVREVPAVIWSTRQRLVEVVGTTPAGKPDTRDVEVSRYLRWGLEMVGTGTAVVAWTDTTATPGWRLDVDEAAAAYTVVCPDGGIAVTGRYRLRDPREGRVTAAWLAAVRAQEAVLLLTGMIIFDGREPDLADAQHHGSLLRGVAPTPTRSRPRLAG